MVRGSILRGRFVVTCRSGTRRPPTSDDSERIVRTFTVITMNARADTMGRPHDDDRSHGRDRTELRVTRSRDGTLTVIGDLDASGGNWAPQFRTIRHLIRNLTRNLPRGYAFQDR